MTLNAGAVTDPRSCEKRRRDDQCGSRSLRRKRAQGYQISFPFTIPGDPSARTCMVANLLLWVIVMTPMATGRLSEARWNSLLRHLDGAKGAGSLMYIDYHGDGEGIGM